MSQEPVLYATDFSDASRAAFDAALAEAKRTGGTLVLLHVAQPPVILPEDTIATRTPYRSLEAAIVRAAETNLRKLVPTAKATGVRASTLVEFGVPADGIVRAACRLHARLIVVGTHGRTGLARLFLGSIAARVMALASCPVLTVSARAAGRRRRAA